MNYPALVLGLCVAVGPAMAHDCHGHHHDWADCDCGRDCNWRRGTGQVSTARIARPIELLKGTLVDLNRASGTAVLETWLKTGSETVLVRMAPITFLHSKGVSLSEGESVEVKGYRAASSGDDLFVVTEVSAQGKSVQLRSDRGVPLW